MAEQNMRLDADEQVFFDNQLALVKSRTYDVEHKALKALSLLPVSTEQDPGATHIIWRSYDKVGMAKIIADYANDFPRADIAGVEHSSPVTKSRIPSPGRATPRPSSPVSGMPKASPSTSPPTMPAVRLRLGQTRPPTKSLPTSLALCPLPRKARTASKTLIRLSCRSRST